tara:strand:- start:445 stop:1035 length:591 start_codon:yes stop_codon:yes gene_type:complete
MRQIKYSKMSGKLTSIDALNTSPLDNEFCIKMHKNTSVICHQCYSIRMLETYRKSCRKVWDDNGSELSKALLTNYPKIKTELFRINSHGELINLTHARNMLNLARANPLSIIAIYTKRPSLIQQAIQLDGLPTNVSLVYSVAKFNQTAPLPEYFHHVFSVFKQESKAHPINCGARDCNSCRECYTGKTVNIYELVK